MIANVLVELSNINIDKTFDYNVPDNYKKLINIGIRVKVPFNNMILEGFVLSVSNSSDCSDLKEIIDIVDDEPILNEELLYLGKYMSNKYYSTLISCYQTMLPKALKAQNKTLINKKMTCFISINKDKLNEFKFNVSQQKLINLFDNADKILKDKLNKVSSSSVKTLIQKGIFIEEYVEDFRLKNNIERFDNKYKLTDEQNNAVDTILNSNELVYLLHGVTGSGKTLVYIEIVKKMLDEGKDSIFLVPEISLTPQMVNAFKSMFGELVAVLHSGLSEGEKYDEYRKIKTGKVKIVVGARSAVFAPFKNIGTFIIDEEHTNSYKQDSNPKYNTIDIAIERAKYYNSKVILGSATPSLESYSRAFKGIYKLIEMKNRINKKDLPNIEIVDMNKEFKKTGMFSKQLIDSINLCLERKEQVILLLNRRGYSSFISCSNCGYTVKCPNCDITLTFHKTSNVLRCHYCGYAEKNIDVCPNCHEKSIKNLGIGTERVEEELNKIFNARVIRMDLDTTTRKGAHERIIGDFKNYKYDILLGTQMISKGLDFSNVTLVSVINADTSLMIPNYKSSEYTFQLLMQTAGRAGRASKEGKVIIQTYNPEHYAISFAKNHDYYNFFKHEMSIRRNLSYPPYYYLVYIKIIGKDYSLLSLESNKIGNLLRTNLKDSVVLGPTTCSVFKINNLFRFGIIIKYKDDLNLDITLKSLIEHYKDNRNVKIDIDVNPSNF